MSIVGNVETVRHWLEENVCSEILLKKPDERVEGEAYTFELVNPSAFSMFLPTKDTLPPGIPAPIPSVLVRFVDGSDMPVGHRARRIKLQLCFAAWNPGLHGGDQIPPDPAKASDLLQRSGEGWMDAWNFVDLAIHKLEQAEGIGNLRLLKEEGITFGQFTEQDSVVEFYPYWFGWVEFTIEDAIYSQPASHQNLL